MLRKEIAVSGIAAGVILLGPVPAHASYSDGFFGIIMVGAGFLVWLVGMLMGLGLAAWKKFENETIYQAWIYTWVTLALVSFVILSARSFEGSDSISPLIILVAWAVYLALLIWPAVAQHKKYKNRISNSG